MVDSAFVETWSRLGGRLKILKCLPSDKQRDDESNRRNPKETTVVFCTVAHALLPEVVELMFPFN